MTRMLSYAALLILWAAPAAAQIGGAKKSDPRVMVVLDKLDYDYKVDDDGDYRVELKTTGGRTQVVYIISQTEEYGILEIREIYSYAFKTGGRLSADLANSLLKDNQIKKLGAWRLIGSGDTQVAAYAVQIAADADPDSFSAALDIVKNVADQREKDEVSSDDF